jgi:hypothetical protein
MHRRVLLEVRDNTLRVAEVPEDTLVVVSCENGFDPEEPGSNARGEQTLEARLRGELDALDGTLSRALALSGAITSTVPATPCTPRCSKCSSGSPTPPGSCAPWRGAGRGALRRARRTAAPPTVYTIVVHEGPAGLGKASPSGTADLKEDLKAAVRRAEEIAATDSELVVDLDDLMETGEKVVLDTSEDPKEGPFYG